MYFAVDRSSGKPESSKTYILETKDKAANFRKGEEKVDTWDGRMQDTNIPCIFVIMLLIYREKYFHDDDSLDVNNDSTSQASTPTPTPDECFTINGQYRTPPPPYLSTSENHLPSPPPPYCTSLREESVVNETIPLTATESHSSSEIVEEQNQIQNIQQQQQQTIVQLEESSIISTINLTTPQQTTHADESQSRTNSERNNKDRYPVLSVLRNQQHNIPILCNSSNFSDISVETFQLSTIAEELSVGFIH
ncbi:unnamed protein product [Didymodactylos carnosus]|uniref:Uncharacterized protein n=1 Tax=Didymodactylos carnosus TaxID=1234261 RepID=A0A814JU48_9BILA|nr:unnamed protein product [Didymodactylos carnosus]CAF3812264.1 unnamed protein product [Didymodactylos carnosus]